jgi:hypothetical protein
MRIIHITISAVSCTLIFGASSYSEIKQRGKTQSTQNEIQHVDKTNYRLENNLYIHYGYKFKIQLPQNWITATPDLQNVLIKAGDAQGASANITVTPVPANFKGTGFSDSLIDDTINHIKSYITKEQLEGFRLLSRSRTTIANMPAIKLHYILPIYYNGSLFNYDAIQYVIAGEKNSFTVSFGAPLNISDSYTNMFDDCINSFAFLKTEQKASGESFDRSGFLFADKDKYIIEGNLYRHYGYKFRIKFPEDWQIKKGDGPTTLIKAANDEGANVNINIKTLPENLGPVHIDNITVEKLTDELKKIYSSVEILGSGKSYIANNPAFWLQYAVTYKHMDMVLHLTMLQYTIAKDNSYYTVTCGAPTNIFSDYEDIFKRCISTFIFEDSMY